MFKAEVIGNLGADAEQMTTQPYNIRFSVAHSEKFNNNGEEETRVTWVSCFLPERHKGLLPYLTKGTRVFVRGYVSHRIFDSAIYHCKMVGVSISVTEIELCGGSSPKEVSESNEKSVTNTESSDAIPF